MDLKEVSISTEYLEQLHGSDLDGTSKLVVEKDNVQSEHSGLPPESIPQNTESETEG